MIAVEEGQRTDGIRTILVVETEGLLPQGRLQTRAGLDLPQRGRRPD